MYSAEEITDLICCFIYCNFKIAKHQCSNQEVCLINDKLQRIVILTKERKTLYYKWPNKPNH